MAAAKAGVALKAETKANAVLTSPPEVEIKAADVHLMHLRVVEEGHLTQDPADARERRAVAAAAALKALLKEEDQKSNFWKAFGTIFPST